MEIEDILRISGAVIVSLGGSAVIVIGFSGWLGKLWANRLMARETAKHAESLENLRKTLEQEIESYKNKLKKSEFIFQKEFEAASEFVAMLSNFLPLQSRPEMDWDDACDEIAQNFCQIEMKLKIFLTKHGAILKKETKEAIFNCIGLAGKHKFMAASSEVPHEANQVANDLYRSLSMVEESLLKQVHSQASI